MFSRFPSIRFMKVNPDAPTPEYAHSGDAGLDLCSMEDVLLAPGEYKMVGSGIAMEIPRGYVGIIHPRSGMGRKGLVIKNTTGVIDSPYRGEMMLPLMNNNKDGFIHVHKGDRVAQLLIQPVAEARLIEVDELSDSDRGAGGFGSTGISGGPRP